MKFGFLTSFGVLAFILNLGSARAEVLTYHLGDDSVAERQKFIGAIQEIRSQPASHEVLEIQGEQDDSLVPSVSSLFPGLADGMGNSAPFQPAVVGNGDVYMLWGDLGDSWTQDEYTKFYSVSKFLVGNHFRNIVNPVANENDVREAVTNPETAVILWSSHGTTDGRIYGSDDMPLSQDVFTSHASPSFKQIVLSNCYGEATVVYYPLPQQVVPHHWTGTTTTDEFFAYLSSTAWTSDLQQDLGIKF